MMHVAAFLGWYGRELEPDKAPASAADIFRQTSGLFHPFCSFPNSESGKVAEYSLAARLTTHAQSVPWSGRVSRQTEHLFRSPNWLPDSPEEQFHTLQHSRGPGGSAFTRMSSFASQKRGQGETMAHNVAVTSSRNPLPDKTGELDSLWFPPGGFTGQAGNIVEERKIQMSYGIQLFSVPQISCEHLPKDKEKRMCSVQWENLHLPPPPGFMIGQKSHATPAGCQAVAGHHKSEGSSSDVHLCSELKTFCECGRSAGCFNFLEGRNPPLEERRAETGEGCKCMQPDSLAPLSSQPDHFPKPATANFLTKFPKSAGLVRPLHPSSCLGTSKPRFPKSADRCLSSIKDGVKNFGKLKLKRRADATEISKVRQSGSSLRPGSFRHALNLAIRCGDLRKGFRCSQCRYFTDRKNNLKRHVITMHQASARVLECCGALFPSKASLREHVTMFHRGGYRCQVCGRNFCRKALLRRHLTVHSGQKDYACAVCGYATSHKSNLERHQRVHTRKPSPGHGAGNARTADTGNETLRRPAHDRKLLRKSRSVKESHEPKAAGTANSDAESRASLDQKLFPPSFHCSSPSAFNAAVNTGESMRENCRKPDPGVSERPVEVKHDLEDHFETMKYFRGPLRQFLLPNRLLETHDSPDTSLALKPGSFGRVVRLDNTNRVYPDTETPATEDLKENTVPPEERECGADGNVSRHHQKNGGNLNLVESEKLSRCDQDNSRKGELCECKIRKVDIPSENGRICQDEIQTSECKRRTSRTRKRMCVLPYHCFSCSLSYSHQAEFQRHPCACLVSSSGLFQFPLSAVVRKGRIPVFPESEQKSCS